MKIAFLVNQVRTEDPAYTTTRLAHEALQRGHEVRYLGCEDLLFDAEGRIQALATSTPAGKRFRGHRAFLAALQGPDALREVVDLAEVDVLMLRNDPASDQVERPWAQSVGILFGQALAARGVLVLNDPTGLAGALNKMYLQHFPPEVRPATLITRDPEQIRTFVKEHRKRGVVLKPLQGSGGQSVFLVRYDDPTNTNQIIEAVERLGYVVAQEYVPAAARGDTRLILLNGVPLEVDGKFCAFTRVGQKGDLRNNVTVGGKVRAAKVTPRMLQLAEAVRPRLVQDGMFLVGLDVVGDRILEINVFSPGGLRAASQFSGVDFTGHVMDAIETKVEHKRRSPAPLPNRELAAL